MCVVKVEEVVKKQGRNITKNRKRTNSGKKNHMISIRKKINPSDHNKYERVEQYLLHLVIRRPRMVEFIRIRVLID